MKNKTLLRTCTIALKTPPDRRMIASTKRLLT